MSETVDLGPDDYVEINPMYLFRWEESQRAYILLYPEGVVKLNETAGEILKRCGGDKSVRELVEELKTHYAGEDVESGVLEFLGESHAKGWIRRK
ncbi:MAG: pyrroloquinoline quinone biosynthesis peptide chaperone PqqD [Rhodospirillales bacterium]